MEGDGSSSEAEHDLASQVVAACQSAIANALANPAEAIGLAQGLSGALATLQLVQSEVEKGEHGSRVVIGNAELLAREALADVLRLAPDQMRALSALDAVPKVAPGPASDPSLATTLASIHPTNRRTAGTENAPSAAARTPLPTFAEVSESYIQMRHERDGGGEESAEIGSLRMRRQTFLELIGDRPVDQYYPRDLQAYVNLMQFWPANVTKRAAFKGQSTREIIQANRDLALRPIARKSLQDGYVANIRTMIRHGMADHDYRDPFSGSTISWPKTLVPSRPREGISSGVLNAVFANGVASGCLDEAMLPLLACLTSRRLGLLLYLRGGDIREKHGVMVAQSDGIVLQNGVWRRVPIKTEESMAYYVLHPFLSGIGFVDWAKQRGGWIFAEAHEHPDPSKYMSKVLNRLLRRSGAAGGHIETFHSLRGDGIDQMREQAVDGRVRRLQAGHELGDVHDLYGSRALTASECQRIAELPLPAGVDFSVFKHLDFDALAAGRRTRGRPRT